MSNDKRIRVLIADDSTFMRKVVQTMIEADPQMEVAGEARDGREAVALAESLRPDVISMDIRMPRVDGLQATEIIMSQNPRPIVIVSSESRAGAESTLRALDLGAVDFVAKPTGVVDLNMESVRGDLMRKLKMAAKVRVVRTAGTPRRIEALDGPQARPATVALPARSNVKETGAGTRFPVVAVAASTGGPAAVMRLVPGFRRGFSAALLLTLHMPATFTARYAEQLAEAASIHVKEAEAGERVQPGTLYVCPGSHHLQLAPTGHIRLLDGPRVSGYMPCADIMMQAVAETVGPMGIGVVLTGMGSDGVQGAAAIKASGGYVLAQDEATSVIFGMPSAAIKTGFVDEVLGIDAIASAVERRTSYLRSAMQVGVL